MSKPLTSYQEGKQRDEAARRRAGAVENGIGKQAALDYLKRKLSKNDKSQ